MCVLRFICFLDFFLLLPPAVAVARFFALFISIIIQISHNNVNCFAIIKFKTKKLALDYLVKSKCPINIPYVDLAMNKKLDDPTISFQRYCNHKIAPNVFDVQICSDYGIDNNTLKGKHITDVNEIRNDIKNDKKVYANYDAETCMIDRVINDDPSLDDTNFKTNFQQYFDRLNTHIDEKFLYLTA